MRSKDWRRVGEVVFVWLKLFNNFPYIPLHQACVVWLSEAVCCAFLVDATHDSCYHPQKKWLEQTCCWLMDKIAIHWQHPHVLGFCSIMFHSSAPITQSINSGTSFEIFSVKRPEMHCTMAWTTFKLHVLISFIWLFYNEYYWWVLPIFVANLSTLVPFLGVSLLSQ